MELGRRERSLVQLGRHDVRKARRRSVGGCDRIAPGALAVPGLEEMKGEDGGLLVGAICCAPLERDADPAVDVPSTLVREPRVGGLPQQVVTEGEPAVTGLLNELRQRTPP